MQEEGLTRHHLLLLHKQVQNKSDIEESLYAYINRARISAYEVGIFSRKKSQHTSLPPPFFDEPFKFIAHGRIFTA